MMEKSSVKSKKNRNEVYQWLTDKTKNGWNSKGPAWNFSKYLVDEQGKLIGHWPSRVKPNDPAILQFLKK